MRIKRAIGSGLRAAGLLLIASTLAAAPTFAGDSQLRFDVREPFEIGGRAFASGLITIHRITSFTPTTTILEVWVDGHCLGMINARNVAAEIPAARNEAIFRRAISGRLVMVGYRAAGASSGGTFRFLEPTPSNVGAPASPGGPATTLASAVVLGTR
jgi:hypothetical protein